jgi:NTP pyrophosphatase (non-canonical NTP hydrolase)
MPPSGCGALAISFVDLRTDNRKSPVHNRCKLPSPGLAGRIAARVIVSGKSARIATNAARSGVTFDEYQKAAARTMNSRLSDRERLLDAAAGIAEEAGEVLAHVRKHLYQGRELNRDALAEELGDVLWCVAGVASASGLRLEDLCTANIRKLESRHGL